MIDEAIGKILGMAMAYGASALGMFVAYVNYRNEVPQLYNEIQRAQQVDDAIECIAFGNATQVQLDGGVGIFNDPSLYAYIEAKRLGWRREHVECFSIGTGYTDNARTFKEASKARKLAQVFNFLSPSDGGLARRSASLEFSKALNELETSKWEFHNIDSIIAEKFDGMDKTKYFNEYCRVGEKLGGELKKFF